MNLIQKRENYEEARDRILEQLRLRPLTRNRLNQKVCLDYSQMSYMLFSLLQSNEIIFELKENIFVFMINEK